MAKLKYRGQQFDIQRSRILFNLRRDKKIPGNAKVFYHQIIKYCKFTNFCNYNNKFLSQQFAVTQRTIQNWLSILEKEKYLYCKYELHSNSNKIKSRKIYIDEIWNMEGVK